MKTKPPPARERAPSSPSANRCAASFLAFVLGFLGKGVASTGANSGLEGCVITGVACAIGVWAYLSCPPVPRVLRYLALVLAGLNLWLAGDTIVRYLRLPLSFPKLSEALWERRAGLKLCFPEPVITCAAGLEQRSPEVARFGIFPVR